MDEKRYVQHISGQGRKWQLSQNQSAEDLDWCVLSENGRTVHHLPQSEYVRCIAPVKVWKDVTPQVAIQAEARELAVAGTVYTLPPGYRWDYHVDARNRYGLTINQQVEVS